MSKLANMIIMYSSKELKFVVGNVLKDFLFHHSLNFIINFVHC